MSWTPIGPLAALVPKKKDPDEIAPEDQALFLKHIAEYCEQHGRITVPALAKYDDVPVDVAHAAVQALVRRGFVRWLDGGYCMTRAGARYLRKASEPINEG